MVLVMRWLLLRTLLAAWWRGQELVVKKASLEVPKISDGAWQSFEDAFSARVSGCRRDCECGREFYDNYNGGYDWDEGELDALAKNPNATPLPYAVSLLEFEGATYVHDCDCWRPRAARIIAFLLNHDEEIADFLTEERKRQHARAAAAPVVQ